MVSEPFQECPSQLKLDRAWPDISSRWETWFLDGEGIWGVPARSLKSSLGGSAAPAHSW